MMRTVMTKQPMSEPKGDKPSNAQQRYYARNKQKFADANARYREHNKSEITKRRREKTVNERFDEILQSLEALSIPDDVVTMARSIYEKAMEKGITAGSPSKYFAPACFLVACYDNEFPILYDDLNIHSFSSYKYVIEQLSEHVLPEMNITARKNVPIERYIDRFCSQLFLTEVQQARIKKFVTSMLKKYDVLLQKYQVHVVAAALIYIDLKLQSFRISQKRVCDVARITPFAIRGIITTVHGGKTNG
jgi:transcription initiation factor TFIIIB Brf1 subunit/transcription initiation factor TFIIB